MMPHVFIKHILGKRKTCSKVLLMVMVCSFLLFATSQFLSFHIISVRAQPSSLLIFAEASSFARLDDIDPSGWFFQAVLHNPTDSDIVVTGLRWWYNASVKIIDGSRDVKCYDSRYFSSLPSTYNPNDRTIRWEYASGAISITVPARDIVVTWIEAPPDSVNNDGELATFYVQAYADGEWLSSPLYVSHSGHDKITSTVFRADFNLTTDPNDELQTHPNPEWLFKEDRSIIANLSTKVRVIPVTSSRNTPGIDYATINVTLPSGWSYMPDSAYNPYGETITPYFVDGKDRLEWDLDRNVVRYSDNQSMAQNYIEFSVTAPYVPGIYNFTVTSIITSLVELRTTTENQYIYAVVKTPPKATFKYSPTTPLTGENVTFNATASYDLDGQIVSYFWDFGDGNTGTGNITAHTYADNETYTITLTITDNDKLNSTASDTILVLNRPPVSKFTESAEIVDTDVVIYFNASESYDPDGSIVSYFWDFDDGTSTTGMIVNHSYADNGTYIAMLTVTDDDGATASTNATKTVLNRPPIANFTESAETVYIGDQIVFNAKNSNDSDGTIVRYFWNFGDGNITITSSNVITHIYHEYRDFNVTLTVIDNDSYNNSTSQIIYVHIHDVAILNVTVSQTDVHIGQVVNITVVAKNEGTTTESFNVTVFGNETIIGTQFVSNLAPDAEKILNFYWDTSDITDTTRFLIQAKADVVSAENDVADNTYDGDIVKVSKVQTDGSPLPFSLDWNWILLISVPPILFLVGGILWKKRRMSRKFRDFDFFDEITDGGIPDSFSVLVTGEPGSGKSVLCQQLAYTFLTGGKSCIYITYDCFPDEVRENMEKFHWNISKYENEGKLLFIDSFSSSAKVTSKEKYPLNQPFSLSDLGITMSQATNEGADGPRVFLDSIVPLLTHVVPSKVVEFLQNRSARIKGVKGTFIFSIGKETIEPNLISRLEEGVDCVIELEVSKGRTVRRMRIKKMRGRKTSSKWIRFEIEPAKGIVFLV